MTVTGGALTQRTEDAIVNLISMRLVEKDLYRECMATLTDEDRALVEACLDRHATRMRAAGEPGW